MNVLVDTSVWVGHFRRADAHLQHLLAHDRVLVHPLVVGEIACGDPPAPRDRTLAALDRLATARVATWPEVRRLIERRSLHGRGCGLVDLALLASTLITPDTRLWTADHRLARLADELGACHAPPGGA